MTRRVAAHAALLVVLLVVVSACASPAPTNARAPVDGTRRVEGRLEGVT
jgi:hypothetical protein